MSVHDLIASVELQTQRIKNHAAAYGQMMRVIEAPAEERQNLAPVFVWPARLSDAPIEIQTDLSALDETKILEVAQAVGSVHYQALYEASQLLAEESQKLLQCFPAQQQQPVEQPSAPAPAPAPVAPVAPAAPAASEIPPIAGPAAGQPEQPGRLVPPGSVQPPGGPPSQ
jgi:hypothetical protein